MSDPKTEMMTTVIASPDSQLERVFDVLRLRQPLPGESAAGGQIDLTTQPGKEARSRAARPQADWAGPRQAGPRAAPLPDELL